MSKPDDKAAAAKTKRSDLTVVAEDVNWRTFVAKEVQAETEFYSNWGFLTGQARGKSH